MSSTLVPAIAIGVPFLMILAVVAIPFIILLLLIMMMRGGSRREKPGQTLAEERALRELSAGLEKMERRMENLETILLERAGRAEDPLGSIPGRSS